MPVSFQLLPVRGNLCGEDIPNAILKKLGITETIATDKNHYIEIAIRLGLDNQWRQTIKDYTKMNIDTVFNDQTCVKSLEKFYQSVVGEGK